MVKSCELIEGVVLDRVETGERFMNNTIFIKCRTVISIA